MSIIPILGIILLTVGHLWLAWTLWSHDDLIWAVLILLVPIPLLGLFAWYQSGWDSTFRAPVFVYLGGYALAILSGLA